MVRTNPKGYEGALVEAIVQESSRKKSTVLPLAACGCIQQAAGAESARVRMILLWNEAQLHFVSLRSWTHCWGAGRAVKDRDERHAGALDSPSCPSGDVCFFRLTPPT